MSLAPRQALQLPATPASVVCADASLELQALVDGMLCKDPVRRLSWQQVTGHPFWLQPLPCLQTPPQPELEALLAQQAQQVIAFLAWTHDIVRHRSAQSEVKADPAFLLPACAEAACTRVPGKVRISARQRLV